MYQPPPLRCSVFDGKKVLLVDSCQATCDVRAAVLRSHGVEVQTASRESRVVKYDCARVSWLVSPQAQ